MTAISIDLQNLSQFISSDSLAECQKKIDQIHENMEKGEGQGNEFLGWLHLPSNTPESLLEEITREADRLRNLADVVVCIGIGGSYLGAKAALTFCSHSFGNQISRYKRGGPEIYFAGHTISSDYLSDLIDVIGDRTFALNVISKSGTTTEPALAFRVLPNPRCRMLQSGPCSSTASRRVLNWTSCQGAIGPWSWSNQAKYLGLSGQSPRLLR